MTGRAGIRWASLIIAVWAVTWTAGDGWCGPAKPGIGAFLRADEVVALIAKVQRPPCQAAYQQLVKLADDGMTKWERDKTDLRIAELAPKLPDLQMEFVPEEFSPPGGKEAGRALGQYATHAAPAAAFVYLLTGEHRYADFAWDAFEQCARVNRWGWFPWGGAHMPQIHFGIVSRNLVLIADCIWEMLTPEQRQHARQVIAEKCVEPYFRIVLHTPGMGLYHLRSRNQGNNALSAALIGSLFIGDAAPDNAIWFRSLLQTYHWAITHDIGWMGQNLELDMPGYWSVSMQNLYTAASALFNVKGVDLRVHPGFDQATYYPIIHEATLPPLSIYAGTSMRGIDPNYQGPMGVLSDKPLGLPHEAYCGAWWLDYAAKFPESPALYFLRQGMVTEGRAGMPALRTVDAHQGALGDILNIAWWDDRLLAAPKPPTGLSQFTDRMAGLRSGYGFGETYLYFNGDLFLSAKKEILCCTSGMSWHFPWHQYQVTETGVETEGEPFAPSMVIKETHTDRLFSFFRAESGFSNVAYYPQQGQRESWKHYDQRDRSILYVRGDRERPDYFLFLDDVRQQDPRWHAWTWHLWNSAPDPGNYGRFEVQSDYAVRAERPNADLWIQFLTPDTVTVEQHGIPSQPPVSYQMDHNAVMMRAVADPYAPVTAKPVTIPVTAWPGLGVAQGDTLYLGKPPVETPVTSQTVTGLTGGCRYRWSLRCKEEDYRVYEATAWCIDLELLDANGNVITKPQSPYSHPDPLRLGAPLSDTPTHDWAETVQYFDAPEPAVACRAIFRAVGSAHVFKLGKLWLSPIDLQPLGKPERTTAQRFLTLVMPLDKGAPSPKLVRAAIVKERLIARLSHPDKTVDEIVLTPPGKLTVTRRRGQQTIARFPATQASDLRYKSLQTNTDASARYLAAGLKPILDQLASERDALTRTGRKNLAIGAKVTASAVRDNRFPPSKVVDNQTAEYPTDGHLDYTLGIVWTSNRFVGYGAGKESLTADPDYFPIYVKPTHWLLPQEQTGWVELELRQPTTVDLVRLLNTSNAGLNDFATMDFRVELYDGARTLLASKDDHFGKLFDRAFDQAFFVPRWFNRYTPSFAGMLERGVPVPFGDGWKDVQFDEVPGTRFVRVIITKYWGIGAGLNEMQVYGR